MKTDAQKGFPEHRGRSRRGRIGWFLAIPAAGYSDDQCSQLLNRRSTNSFLGAIILLAIVNLIRRGRAR